MSVSWMVTKLCNYDILRALFTQQQSIIFCFFWPYASSEDDKIVFLHYILKFVQLLSVIIAVSIPFVTIWTGYIELYIQNRMTARLQKCRQICIFSMPLVFTGIYGIYGKYGGKYGIYGKFNGQLSNMSCSTTAKKFQIGSFCFTMMTSSCSLL